MSLRAWRFKSSLAHQSLFRREKSSPSDGFIPAPGAMRKNVDLSRYGRLAQLARAPDLHSGGRGFESLIAHQDTTVDLRMPPSNYREIDCRYRCSFSFEFTSSNWQNP